MDLNSNAVASSGNPLPSIVYSLGAQEMQISKRLASWRQTHAAAKIWAKDPTFWFSDTEKAHATKELTNRLGWLTLPDEMQGQVSNLKQFTEEIRRESIKDVVLLGMGGSSPAPETYSLVFGSRPNAPKLTVLDSTHPDTIAMVEGAIHLEHTLFVVSSKSGGTIETLSFFKYFWNKACAKLKDAAAHFVAITDPGSKFEAQAKELHFRRIFSSPSDVGGRYSALTLFGLVPAALLGIDLNRLLSSSSAMAEACKHEIDPSVPLDSNPGLTLGAIMGEFACLGRDKLSFFASKTFESFGPWLEQLVAESLGKQAKGVLPVEGEGFTHPSSYGNDRVIVGMTLEGDETTAVEEHLERAQASGHPTLRIHLQEREQLGAEFFRWEMANAAAGAVLEINPFDQPNVEQAKVKARGAIEAFEKEGRLAFGTPLLTADSIKIYSPLKELDTSDPIALIHSFKALRKPGNYLCLMAYVPQSASTVATLQATRQRLRDSMRLATTLGFGPRFLHSTGQLHKGDGNGGLFVQISQIDTNDLPIPDSKASFGTLIQAQALGDYEALVDNHRRVIRLHIEGPLTPALNQIVTWFNA